jgi:hypothetical protein
MPFDVLDAWRRQFGSTQPFVFDPTRHGGLAERRTLALDRGPSNSRSLSVRLIILFPSDNQRPITNARPWRSKDGSPIKGIKIPY